MNKSAILCLLILPLIMLSLIISTKIQADSAELPCPESPNCVSSLVSGKRGILPFYFKSSDTSQIKDQLVTALQNWPNAEIISSNEQIVITVFTTPWLKFKDDLILIIRPDGRVDVRSSSRAGYYDFGANRRRVERLRTALVPDTR